MFLSFLEEYLQKPHVRFPLSFYSWVWVTLGAEGTACHFKAGLFWGNLVCQHGSDGMMDEAHKSWPNMQCVPADRLRTLQMNGVSVLPYNHDDHRNWSRRRQWFQQIFEGNFRQNSWDFVQHDDHNLVRLKTQDTSLWALHQNPPLCWIDFLKIANYT